MRELNSAARWAITRALKDAAPRLPALISHLQTLELARFEVDIDFVDDAQMRVLNSQFRGKTKPTDVLSFAMWEDEFGFAPGADVLLGDLVISIETAVRQARELNHALRAEVAFLAVHGALHLLGYDHGDDQERRKMFALQDQIVAAVREDKGF